MSQQPVKPSVPVGELEMEFDVAIPGRIVSPEHWAQTAIKKLPESGVIDFRTVFGREAPIVLEIGCGNGRFTISSAVQRPTHDHLATDILPVVIRYATRRGKERGLWNTRFAVCDGFELLNRYIAPDTVSEIHVYHPQPFTDKKPAAQRMLTPEFFALAHRSLKAHGTFFLQTDNRTYWDYLCEIIPRFMEWHPLTGEWPDELGIRSRREMIARHQGLSIFRGWARRRDDLAYDDLVAEAVDMPRPVFESDRQPRSKNKSHRRRKFRR